MKVLAVQTVQFASQVAARAGGRRPRSCRRVTRVHAEGPNPFLKSVDLVDENIGDFCSLDQAGRRPIKELSLGEKEQLFLEAMASFYYDQASVLSNEEFDNLKEELVWEGSKVVVMTGDEKRFLEARLAFKKGSPIMSDADYNALKLKLEGSGVFSLPREGPSCTLTGEPVIRGEVSAQAQMDWAKMVLLALPTALAIGGSVMTVDFLTGGNLLRLPGTVGVVIWSAILLPSLYVFNNAISSFLFKDALVLKAPCPNCGEPDITTYFGDILTVAGSRETNTVKCPCCQSELTFDAVKQEVKVAKTAQA